MRQQTVTAYPGRGNPLRLEMRPYCADGWLHLYRTDELESGQALVTPKCAVSDPFYPIDHERALIGEPTQRGEIHPGCLNRGG